MIVAIQQPEHLPWLGFFDKMQKCDAYVFLDNVQFKKRYFENRNKIRVENGWQWVTVPVISKGRYKQKISDVEIDYSTNWQKKYLGRIKRSYSKTCHYNSFYPYIGKIINNGYFRLVDLNIALINFCSEYLDIHTPCYLASEIDSEEASGSDLILNLCRSFEATIYISGPDGQRYLKTEKFRSAGIDIVCHDYSHPVYKQNKYNEFVSHMSVCDYIFNHGGIL